MEQAQLFETADERGYTRMSGAAHRRESAVPYPRRYDSRAAAFTATRVLASRLYEVRPTDPMTFGTVPVVFVAAALPACDASARRAARVHSMAALPCE